MAAILEAARAAIVEVPGCAVFSELELDENATASEIVWVGTPPRLVVLARYPTKATVQLIDPFGPRVIATLELESPRPTRSSLRISSRRAVSRSPPGRPGRASSSRSPARSKNGIRTRGSPSGASSCRAR
jgi:hypothetical protein